MKNPEDITFSKSIYQAFLGLVGVLYIMDLLFKNGIMLTWMKEIILAD